MSKKKFEMDEDAFYHPSRIKNNDFRDGVAIGFVTAVVVYVGFKILQFVGVF